MRIACLQFAPQVGDTDNNLNRADAVLAKANQDDIDSLDLIVLPELAFSGWNHRSLEEISPYLEPSGSGISSLWARTVALKHNTNVLVGYPEKVDRSGHLSSSPEFYNSAILVNGDGETVANYRKTFLYRLDEKWAHEGKGFFGDYVPGLGNTAIGICTDINPYRLEAPWHAFEFAFHILEARANLVIVTMAWLTGENCEQFTQFPNEPDMEALSYWAQRLEPVIRDESQDEVIIVFCNRTGIEGDAVYSGTSAVLGIHQGEVRVYGLLGRGVKDLLVVDTDDPPFASLTLRKEKVHLSPVEYDSNPSEQSSGSATYLLTPLPADPDDRAPTKYLSAQPISRQDPQSGEREQRSTPCLSTTVRTSTIEITDIPTPTAPSPTPMSARPQLDVPSLPLFRDRLIGLNSKEDHIPEHTKPLDGGGLLPFDEDQDIEGLPHQQYGLPSTTSSSPGPASARTLPEKPQPPSTTAKPTIPAGYSSDDMSERESSRHRSSRSARASPVSNWPVESERHHRSEQPKHLENSETTGSEMVLEARPARPSSPKSRNVSQIGQHRRRRSDEEQSDLFASLGRGEIVRRRTQSVLSHRRDCDSTTTQGRQLSPKPRSASLSSRHAVPDDELLLERALDFYLRFMPVDIRDQIIASTIRRSRPDLVMRHQNTEHGDITRSPLQNPRYSSPHPERSASQGLLDETMLGDPTDSRTVDSRRDTQEPDAMLWKEISKVVEEYISKTDSGDASRGRRRSRSANPTKAQLERCDTSPALSQTRPRDGCLRNGDSRSAQAQQIGRSVSAARHATPSQIAPWNGPPLRSVRDPSLGPPLDPDDEIVAEIIFHRPGCPPTDSKDGSADVPGAQTQAIDNTTASTKKPESSCDTGTGRNELERHPPADDESEKTPTFHKTTTAKQDLGFLSLKTSAEDLRNLRAPNLSTSSLHTLSSYEESPVTPPPRTFEPRTPKPMVLGVDCAPALSPVIDKPSVVSVESLDAFLDEKKVTQAARPRSAFL